jgi:hypothetical protein
MCGARSVSMGQYNFGSFRNAGAGPGCSSPGTGNGGSVVVVVVSISSEEPREMSIVFDTVATERRGPPLAGALQTGTAAVADLRRGQPHGDASLHDVRPTIRLVADANVVHDLLFMILLQRPIFFVSSPRSASNETFCVSKLDQQKHPRFSKNTTNPRQRRCFAHLPDRTVSSLCFRPSGTIVTQRTDAQARRGADVIETFGHRVGGASCCCYQSCLHRALRVAYRVPRGSLEEEIRLFKLAPVLSSSFVPNTVADQRPLCRAARCFNLAVPVAALSPLLLSSPPSWARIQSAPFNSFIHPIVSLSKSSSAGKGWRCGSDEQVWRKHGAAATNAERIWWQRLDLFGSSPFLLFLQRQSYLT